MSPSTVDIQDLNFQGLKDFQDYYFKATYFEK